MAYILSVCGYKDSGKTSLCKRLAEMLHEEFGLDVGYIKHCHDSVLSADDTDSGAIARLGIDALLWGTDGIRLETMDNGFSLQDIEKKFFPTKDVVIVEGAKSLLLPKIWVGQGPPSHDIKGIYAIYEGPDDLFPKLPHFRAGEERPLAEWILQRMGKIGERVLVYMGDKKVGLNEFVMDFIAGTVRGMLGSLKGIEDRGEEIAVIIKKQKKPE